jgi:hypothetical protein
MRPVSDHFFWLGRSAEIAVACAALLVLLLTGCMSNDYKLAAKNTPPAVPLLLSAEQPPVTAELDTLIVFHGAGSWKQEAYWDEYVISLVNHGQRPVTVEGAVLKSGVVAAAVTHPSGEAIGTDPWALEKQSQKILKDQGHRIVADAGPNNAIGGLNLATMALASTAFATGSSAAVAGATVGAIALPMVVVGSTVVAITGPYAIQKEFNRRRLALPLELQPGETRHGSLFFPITPGPQRLEVNFRGEGAEQTASIDLAVLAHLHFAQPPGAPTPPGSSASPLVLDAAKPPVAAAAPSR